MIQFFIGEHQADACALVGSSHTGTCSRAGYSGLQTLSKTNSVDIHQQMNSQSLFLIFTFEKCESVGVVLSVFLSSTCRFQFIGNEVLQQIP